MTVEMTAAERQEASQESGVSVRVQDCCSQQLAIAVVVSKDRNSSMGQARQSFPPLGLRVMG